MTGNATGCCGCRACEQICPSRCISIIKDEEGFLIPSVDSGKCIECNACSKVCPIENPVEGAMPSAVYATASSDSNTKIKSSSGGVFYLLANRILSLGGAVVGADLDLEKRYLRHTIVESLDNLNRLLGSKYIASDTRSTFTEVKRLLSEGRKVLYVGTPCQIAGLNSFIKTGKENLFTCDLLCHGVPSQFVFDSYINFLEQKHRGEVVDFIFRDKEKFGWSITLRYAIRKGKSTKFHYVQAGLSPYFYGFLRGKFLRESCYHCPYTKLKRTGDITLADFWGVEKLNISDDVSKGCSCVLVNTSKGTELFDSINDNLQFKHKVLYEQAYRQDINFLEPCVRPQERDFAIKSIKTHSFKYVASRYCKNPRRFRIRIKEFLMKYGLIK